MADIKQKYGTDGVAITITLDNLANGAWRQSDYIDNATDLFLRAKLHAIVKTTSTVSATGYVNFYASGSVDGGTTYGGGCTGTDGSYTPNPAATPNLKFLGRVNCDDNNTSFSGPLMQVEDALGGDLPKRWVILAENKTGAALDNAGGNNTVKFQGTKNTVT